MAPLKDTFVKRGFCILIQVGPLSIYAVYWLLRPNHTSLVTIRLRGFSQLLLGG